MIDLAGRTALVTGAGGGMGFGIDKALATAGARVAVNDIDGSAAATLGAGAAAAPGDVSDQDAVEAMMAAPAIEGLDILMNNAGIPESIAPISKQSSEDWGRVIDMNLRGAYLMSRAVAPSMRRLGSGSIINIVSVAGLTGFPASCAYDVSKAGLVMLTKTLACELARFGVRVNAVAPGVIDAPMLHQLTADKARMAATVARVPLGRLGAPEDIGSAVAFLCSRLATYITSVVLPVDGGWLAFGGIGDAYPAQRP